MPHYKLDEIEEELARYGINKQFNRTRDRRQTEWRLLCRGKDCRTELILHWQAGTAAQTLLGDVDRKGWLIGRGDRPLCPACQRAITRKAKELSMPKPQAPLSPPLVREDVFTVEASLEASTTDIGGATMVDEVTMVEASSEASTTPAGPGADVQPSPKIARQIYALLDEMFDEQAGAYRNGYSDEKIATECSCHLNVVVKVRLAAYGELVEDTRVSALRSDMIAYGKSLAKFMKQANDDLNALRSRLEQLAMSTRR